MIEPRTSVPAPHLPELLSWYAEFSRSLVRLSDCSLPQIREAVERMDAALADHARSPGTTRELEADHLWFQETRSQLQWLVGILNREDHGGHRQALGQYGLLVVESVVDHLTREADISRPPSPRGEPTGRGEPASTNIMRDGLPGVRR